MNCDIRVSIVINNYNYGRFLREAVESALAQTWRDTELIVVDDGSTDDSREVIAAFGDRVVPVLKRNGGQCSCVNEGFARSSGGLICFLDSDDVLLPTAMEKAVCAMRDGGASKVHWPIAAVDVSGRRIERARVDLPSGDLLDFVAQHGPGCYPCAPTSGNAWARGYLMEILPIPVDDYVTAVDSYLELLAPFFGEIRTVDEPQTLYRIHGGNSSASLPYSEQVRMYEYRCDILAKHLRQAGVSFDPERWKDNSYRLRCGQLARIGDDLGRTIPSGAAYILVDNDEWAQGALLAQSRAIPFLENNGQYWGAPANDATAVRELERLHKAGAEFLVVAEPAFWWLDHYAEFASYLRGKYQCISQQAEFVVFDLRGDPDP
jgi:glycosyltransferase involved in cell wall biosynthesis